MTTSRTPLRSRRAAAGGRVYRGPVVDERHSDRWMRRVHRQHRPAVLVAQIVLVVVVAVPVVAVVVLALL